MSRVQTANYTAVPETSFFYATDDGDIFDREDVSFLARALEQHTHAAGKGLPVARIASGLITAAELAAGSVTTAKIADLNVTNGKLAADAVTADKIAAGAVGASEIVDGGVGTAELADGSVTSAKLFAGAVVAHLGYTPANILTPTLTGPVTIVGSLGVSNIATGSVAASGQITGNTAVIAASLQAGEYRGGTSLAGTPSFLGLVVGLGGVAVTGALAGADAVLTGFLVAAGIVRGRTLESTVATGTAPMVIASTTLVANLNAAQVASKTPTATPAAGALPLADGAGKLDTWITAPAGLPSGMGSWVPTAAAIPATWTRYTAMDGRIPVGAGTTFTVTYVEATNYGTSWSHNSTTANHAHSGGALGVSGSTGAAAGGVAYDEDETGSGHNTRDDAHTHDQGTLDVTGSTSTDGTTTSSDAWIIPSRAVVWMTKN